MVIQTDQIFLFEDHGGEIFLFMEEKKIYFIDKIVYFNQRDWFVFIF